MSEVETRLAEIRERVEKATPGPWTDAIAPAEESGETPAEFLTGALCGAGPLYVVWSPNGTGDGFQYLIPAATGDGPESAANAAFIAAARSDVPWLLDQLARVRADTITEVEKAIRAAEANDEQHKDHNQPNYKAGLAGGVTLALAAVRGVSHEH